MADFSSYEQQTIHTKALDGSDCIFYIHEEPCVTLDVNQLDELMRKSLREGQSVAIADMLDEEVIAYFESELACEEDYAYDNGLIDSEEELKARVISLLSECISCATIHELIGDEPAKREFINNTIDCYNRDNDLGDIQSKSYDIDLSDNELLALSPQREVEHSNNSCYNI